MEDNIADDTYQSADGRSLQALPCPSCNKMYSEKTRTSFERHIANCGTANYQCDDCGNSFISKVTLRNHLKLHIDKIVFPCKNCGREFKSKYRLQLHTKTHLDKKEREGERLKCEYCPKSFAWPASLTRHLQSHYNCGTAAYTCVHCGRNFNKYSEFYNHKKAQCKSKKVGKVEDVDDAFGKSPSSTNPEAKSPTTKPVPLISDEKDTVKVQRHLHKCQFCEMDFDERWQLDEHVETCDPYISPSGSFSQEEKNGIAKMIADKMLKSGVLTRKVTENKKAKSYVGKRKKKKLPVQDTNCKQDDLEADNMLESLKQQHESSPCPYLNATVGDDGQELALKLKIKPDNEPDTIVLSACNAETQDNFVKKRNEKNKIIPQGDALENNITKTNLIKQRLSKQIRAAPTPLPSKETVNIETTATNVMVREKRKRKLKQFTDFTTDFGRASYKRNITKKQTSIKQDTVSNKSRKRKDSMEYLSDEDTLSSVDDDGDVKDADFKVSEINVTQKGKTVKKDRTKNEKISGRHKIYSCTYCKQEFKQDYTLKQHIATCNWKKNVNAEVEVKSICDENKTEYNKMSEVESVETKIVSTGNDSVNNENEFLPISSNEYTPISEGCALAVENDKSDTLVKLGKDFDKEHILRSVATVTNTNQSSLIANNSKSLECTSNKTWQDERESKKGIDQNDLPELKNSDTEIIESKQKMKSMELREKVGKKGPKVKKETTERFSRLPFSNNCLSEIYKDEKVMQAMYRCTTANCSSKFSWKKSLAKHKLTVHFEKFVYLCYECQKTFSSDNVLKSHIRMAHSKLKCVPLAIMNTEILTADGEKEKRVLICVTCGYTYTEDNSEFPHDCTPYQLRFLCPYCDGYFPTFADSQKHVKEKHPDDVLSEKSEERYTSQKGMTREASHGMDGETTKCDTCQDEFQTNEQLKQHINQKHANFPFCCGVCGFSFGRTSAINRHLLIHRRATFSCMYCSKGFYDKSSLERHTRIHTGERPCQCDICGNGYCDDKAVRKHMKFKHSVAFKERYKDSLAVRNMETSSEGRVCHMCGDSFDSVNKLESHLLSHCSDWHLRCTQCSKVFLKKREFEQHKLKHFTENISKGKMGKVPKILNVSGTVDTRRSLPALKIMNNAHPSGKPIQCGLCGKRFRRTSLLNYHIHALHLKEDDKNCICSICHHGFSRQFMLDNHMRVHTDIRPYKCRLCHKTFKQLAHIRDHLRAHGKSIYPCKLCTKSFKTRGTLAAHVVTHSRLYPFKCPKKICKKQFRDLTQLMSHCSKCFSSEEIAKEPYQCNMCELEFVKTSDILHHLYTHDLEYLYPCDLCTLKFSSYRSLYFHKSDEGHFNENELSKIKNAPEVTNVREKSYTVVPEVKWDFGVTQLMSQYDYIISEDNKADAMEEHDEKVKEFDAEESEPVNESASYMHDSDELFLIAEQLTYMASGTDHYKEIIVPEKCENQSVITDVTPATSASHENNFAYEQNSISENLGYPTIIIRDGNVHYANSVPENKLPQIVKVKDSLHNELSDSCNTGIAESNKQIASDQHLSKVQVWTAGSYDMPERGSTDINYETMVDKDVIVEPFQVDAYTTYDNEEITETLVATESAESIGEEFGNKQTETDDFQKKAITHFQNETENEINDPVKKCDDGINSPSGTQEVEEIKGMEIFENKTSDETCESDKALDDIANKNTHETELTPDIPITLTSPYSPYEVVGDTIIDATTSQQQVKVIDQLGNEVIVCIINEKGEQEQITDGEEILQSVMQTGRYTIQDQYQQYETMETEIILDHNTASNFIGENNTANDSEKIAKKDGNPKVTNIIVVHETPETNHKKCVQVVKTKKSSKKAITNTKKILGKLNLDINKSETDNFMKETDNVDIMVSLNYYEDRPDNETPHKCDMCTRRFGSIKTLNFHKKTHLSNKERKFQCTTCGAGFHVPKALEIHMRIHTGDKPYSCKVCSKAFRQRGHLQIHLRIHANFYPFECNFCAKKYASNSNLTRHIKQNHMDEEPGEDFACNICNKLYKNMAALRSHQMSHLTAKSKKELLSVCNGIKGAELSDDNDSCVTASDTDTNTKKSGFMCDVCGLVLKTHPSLKLHRMRHETGTDFKCTECGKGFPTEELVKDHAKQHTQESTPCEFCGKQFKNKRTLRLHLAQFHDTVAEVSKYQCAKCKKQMNVKQSFITHITACMKDEFQKKLMDNQT